MTYRTETPGPTYRWRCATDTADAFIRAVRDEYGLTVRRETAAHGPYREISFDAGSVRATAHANGDVMCRSHPGVDTLIFGEGKLKAYMICLVIAS